LRVCIICRGNDPEKKKFSIVFLCSFRSVDIYKLEFFGKITARRVRKGLRALSALKVSFAVFEEELPFSSLADDFGITVADSGRALSSRIAETALFVSERLNLPKRFFIRGGSFFGVTRIALRLLRETGDVAVSCTDYEAVASACFDACGAVIKNLPDRECMEIFPARREAFLVFGDKSFSYADFKLSLPPPLSDVIPATFHTAVASLLETCGVSDALEVSTEKL